MFSSPSEIALYPIPRAAAHSIARAALYICASPCIWIRYFKEPYPNIRYVCPRNKHCGVSVILQPSDRKYSSASSCCNAETIAGQSLIIPAFCLQISNTVLPSNAVCSSETEVMTASSFFIIALVLSVNPPNPHSNTTYSLPSERNISKAAAVSISNAVGLSSIAIAIPYVFPR